MDSLAATSVTDVRFNGGGFSSQSPPSLFSTSPPPPGSQLSPPSPPGSSIGGSSSNSSPSPSEAPNGSSQDKPSDMDSPSPTHSPGSPSNGKHKRKSSHKDDSDIAGLVAGVVILILIIACVICITRRKKKRPKKHTSHRYPQGGGKHQGQPMDYVVKFNQGTPGGAWGTPGRPPTGLNSSEFSEMGYQQSPLRMGGYGGKSQFTYEELAAATDGFSEANVLGQGGFGFVYKGVLPDGKIVAVKSLKAGSGQGEREFQAEVEIISRVHHRHLVSLVGYCISSDKRMLVYDFVPNKTLEFHLHEGQPVMDWATRLRIAVGSAKGLAYLHEDCHPRIIHRDIKSANILLDNKFEAMVADFGLAKFNVDNFTHVSTRVMGTFGYLAPEYAASGKLTEKSDVFSFGIMLVEIISGRRPVDPTNKMMEDSLVDWARPLMAKALEDGDYSELVDPRLGDNYTPQEMARMVSCANAASRHSARRRPRMSQIVRALDGGSLDDLNEKSKTGPSPAATPNSHADIYDTRAYNADIMKFRKMVILDEDDSSSADGTTIGSSSKP